MRKRYVVGVFGIGLTLLLAACGGPSRDDVREAVKRTVDQQMEMMGGSGPMAEQRKKAVDAALNGLTLKQCTKTTKDVYECTVSVQGIVKKVQMTQSDGKWYAVIQDSEKDENQINNRFVNNPALKDGACIQAPPQFRIPLQARGFGFLARCFRGG